ncbi:large conductance mechanosensitive channel protein MscL [Verticiella sediminum]|uniref:Large-conductance mechanosensitive channel n=1 Tax=Verticiella sediminum TaxID=1247510 RepID=A0A556A860_9BURK|nr:large conductance mechanosensitive channel protein MscL [Verticiella sediminum]TSH89053.1 large conductance mechanosensitive channel protein MscL [Verticiella sediminum]
MKGFLREFQTFAVKGNVMDLAVGVIIGGAFGRIVDSMVKDVIMPLINVILGGSADFTNKFIVLRMPEDYTGPMTYADLTQAGAILFAWGNFLTILINFVLLAFVVFLMVKALNKARARFEHEEKVAPAEPAPPSEEVVLLREIRDALAGRTPASPPSVPPGTPS